MKKNIPEQDNVLKLTESLREKGVLHMFIILGNSDEVDATILSNPKSRSDLTTLLKLALEGMRQVMIMNKDEKADQFQEAALDLISAIDPQSVIEIEDGTTFH